MIALQYVVSAAVGGYASERRGNENIRVGVSISVSIGGKIVGNQVTAHGNVLGDGLTMIPGHPRCEVLRSLDSPGRGFNRQARDGDRRAGPCRVGIQQLLAY